MKDYDIERRQAALRAIHLEQAIRELPPQDSPAAKIIGALGLVALFAAVVLLQFL